MKFTVNSVLFIVLLIGAAQIAGSQVTSPGTAANTGIATMFARDPLTQSICFKDGLAGAVFQNGQTRNRCSDLNFNSYSANAFSVGIEGGKQGTILDLGTPEELRSQYGFTETVGNGQGFASIDVRNGKALILKDLKASKLQELSASSELFRLPAAGYSSVSVKLGHVYLMRIVDRNDKTFEMFAKVLVLAYAPNESVTVRWQVLGDDRTAQIQNSRIRNQ